MADPRAIAGPTAAASARLGLSSAPAQVERLTAEGVVLLVARRPVPGTITVVELVNVAGTFVRIRPLRLVEVAPHADGCCAVQGQFLTPLADEELLTLLSLRR
jgi:hypothetical protein